ncbi:isochorismatase family protein [Salipaludibacillus sp. LMS25]|uniref:isochorismatase family protein n=1 Tax=Salipaludibacillus sp. LMS25 TaxID=2924031 RepID=UPI0020D0A00A|nr:isochorismatase family protein [Salipaludibacillus sp. LMS25]UTR13121.1 isochorismatase family protein [Salipaludibacillus sp. LMS25]
MNQALLVIDAQQDLIEGNMEGEQAVFEKERLINSINGVIEKAIHDSVSVIFIRDLDVAGGKGAGFQVHQGIHIPPHAVIFDKMATNSFYGTPLLAYLNENKIGHVVIMGCKTEHCIDTAVRTATINHVDVTLVGDGHATSDSPVLSAKQIIQHHNDILHGHYNVDHFSVVRNSHDELFTPIHHRYR